MSSSAPISSSAIRWKVFSSQETAGTIVKENYQKTGDVKANEVQVGPVKIRQEYYPKKK